jgi:hypothetical protein
MAAPSTPAVPPGTAVTSRNALSYGYVGVRNNTFPDQAYAVGLPPSPAPLTDAKGNPAVTYPIAPAPEAP